MFVRERRQAESAVCSLAPYLNNSHQAQSPFSFYEPPVAVQGSFSLFIFQSLSCARIPAFLNFAFCCKAPLFPSVFHNELWRYSEACAVENCRLSKRGRASCTFDFKDKPKGHRPDGSEAHRHTKTNTPSHTAAPGRALLLSLLT